MLANRMPRAHLESRPGDIPLTNGQVLRLSLFAGLQRKPNLERFPGAVVLRTFRPGDTICWQGEAGWTAFYVLTTEDMLALRLEQRARGEGDHFRLSAKIGRLRRRLADMTRSGDPAARAVGTVHLAFPRAAGARKPALERLARATGRPVPGTPVRGPDMRTLYVPVDGPATLSYDTLRVPLCEGELVGEASCMYRTPRPATVVATRKCYVLEILRNILDQMYKDPVFRDFADDSHRRGEAEAWRKLPLFAELTDEQFALVRDELGLVQLEPGAVVCDEHEPADALYVVRRGLVQVAKNVSALLGPEAVRDWDGLWAALRPDATSRATAHDRLAALVAEHLPGHFDWGASPGGQTPAARAALVQACNRVLTKATLVDDPAFGSVLEASPLRYRLAEVLGRRREARHRGRHWSDREARRCNRMLLEALVPGAFRPLEGQGGLETVLAYRAAGEWFGEQAVLDGTLHESTCTACSHPGDEGVVEIVRVPAAAFRRLLRTAPDLREHLVGEAGRRREQARECLGSPPWADAGPVQASRAFEELGLIQGRQLMLVDLDRCTRCGDCVRACAETHADGLARLTLDGPRLGKYLVPTTCRSCLDPVCLIGCPVGSIHRGDRRQIVIEDWCIGCGLCADRCPYGAIQMRDVGILPEQSAAWRFLPGEAVTADDWHERVFRDRGWLAGEAPFRYDRDLYEELATRRTAGRGVAPGAVLFRCTFRLAPSSDGVRYRLELTSHAPAAGVWVDGEPAEAVDEARQGRSMFILGKDGPGPRLHTGTNAIAACVELPKGAPGGQVLLGLRLDEVRRPHVPADVERGLAEEVTEKLVTHNAAVCDLCSDLPGRSPACVRVCPHEAALRLDARSEFPQDVS
jgi:Fe-S-cluster-containing hydrogenase component 2/CRP-like cAMP-binding protein